MVDISEEELLRELIIELLKMKIYLSKMSNIDFKEGKNGI